MTSHFQHLREATAKASASLNKASTASKVPAFREWDAGLFDLELVHQGIFPHRIDILPKHAADTNLTVPDREAKAVKKGSFAGTQKAVSAVYSRGEQSFASYFDAAAFESTMPRPQALTLRRDLFTYQIPGSDQYPPHLHQIPPAYQNSLTEIFNWMRLLDTASILTQLVPDVVEDFIHSNPESDTMAGLAKRNQELRAQKKDIFKEPNIGDRDDWYTDRIFAQQQFTGTNPVTLEKVSKHLYKEFVDTAEEQKNDGVAKVLAQVDIKDLYVQDYSYFRNAVKVDPHDDLHSIKDESFLHRIADFFSSDARNDDAIRYLCAAVCLFHLEASGDLHPLAIVIDYKESMHKSVVLFNKRLSSTDRPANHSEENDWPWRYAKTCVSASEWTRHEVAVHLTNAHFVEEATIVAAQRSFEQTHPVYSLLQPHWFKTLSLNAAARSILVPNVISKIAGLEETQIYQFINHAYNTFDWTANFIPNDLERRGFPVAEIGKDSGKYQKYTYARNMLDMWNSLRKFVAGMLRVDYPTDKAVQQDQAIQAWDQEMRANYGGNLTSFPAAFHTFDEIVDTVTMCIHIAAPQHTAVNYLQDYYQSFVVNKPPCLCQPPPKTLKDLTAYRQPDLMKAVPVNAPRVWLLASHLPYLLSYKVAGDQNLVTYARSLQKLSLEKINEQGSPRATAYTKTAEAFLDDLITMGATFALRSEQLVRNGNVRYDVLDPVLTANSILI
ncbi:hypothetical protein FH972_022872 [Carpinus fangiana]|uniref:Lipoxygenase domain-containing protein n=1 Tax=Carpinus fangiana TaxID=176857 RepID=A0A5N6KU08_9ROSI|nr:hypothetical protein FH972_022872 [Carpinus fangiana]